MSEMLCLSPLPSSLSAASPTFVRIVSGARASSRRISNRACPTTKTLCDGHIQSTNRRDPGPLERPKSANTPKVTLLKSESARRVTSRKLARLKNLAWSKFTSPSNVDRPKSAVPWNLAWSKFTSPSNVDRPKSAVPWNLAWSKFTSPSNVDRPKSAVPWNLARLKLEPGENVIPAKSAFSVNVTPSKFIYQP